MKRLVIVLAACLSVFIAMLAFTGCSTADYLPEAKSPTVATPTIGESGTLRVGVDIDKTPLAGMNDGKIIGMDVDIAAALADEMGLKVSIVEVGSDPAQALSEGKVDIVMGIDSAESISEFWLSEEYLPTGIAIFALEENAASLPDATSPIAAQVSSTSSWAVGNVYGQDVLVSTADLTTAFSQLGSGEVRFAAADAIIGMYAAHRDGIDACIIALLSKPGGYCIGVPSENTELQTAVSSALQTLITGGNIDIIEKKWLGKAMDLDAVTQIEASSSAAAESDVPSAADTSSQSTTSAHVVTDAEFESGLYGSEDENEEEDEDESYDEDYDENVRDHDEDDED